MIGVSENYLNCILKRFNSFTNDYIPRRALINILLSLLEISFKLTPKAFLEVQLPFAKSHFRTVIFYFESVNP